MKLCVDCKYLFDYPDYKCGHDRVSELAVMVIGNTRDAIGAKVDPFTMRLHADLCGHQAAWFEPK